METGVSPPPLPPRKLFYQFLDATGQIMALTCSFGFLFVYRFFFFFAPSKLHSESLRCQGQALDLLVSVGSRPYNPYTSDLSTGWSSRSLTPLRDGIPNLRGSFALRCFQRLSLPDLATQLCRWHDN
jgi:hypothetical protein